MNKAALFTVTFLFIGPIFTGCDNKSSDPEQGPRPSKSQPPPGPELNFSYHLDHYRNAGPEIVGNSLKTKVRVHVEKGNELTLPKFKIKKVKNSLYDLSPNVKYSRIISDGCSNKVLPQYQYDCEIEVESKGIVDGNYKVTIGHGPSPNIQSDIEASFFVKFIKDQTLDFDFHSTKKTLDFPRFYTDESKELEVEVIVKRNKALRALPSFRVSNTGTFKIVKDQCSGKYLGEGRKCLLKIKAQNKLSGTYFANLTHNLVQKMNTIRSIGMKSSIFDHVYTTYTLSSEPSRIEFKEFVRDDPSKGQIVKLRIKEKITGDRKPLLKLSQHSRFPHKDKFSIQDIDGCLRVPFKGEKVCRIKIWPKKAIATSNFSTYFQFNLINPTTKFEIAMEMITISSKMEAIQNDQINIDSDPLNFGLVFVGTENIQPKRVPLVFSGTNSRKEKIKKISIFPQALRVNAGGCIGLTLVDKQSCSLDVSVNASSDRSIKKILTRISYC